MAQQEGRVADMTQTTQRFLIVRTVAGSTQPQLADVVRTQLLWPLTIFSQFSNLHDTGWMTQPHARLQIARPLGIIAIESQLSMNAAESAALLNTLLHQTVVKRHVTSLSVEVGHIEVVIGLSLGSRQLILADGIVVSVQLLVGML